LNNQRKAVIIFATVGPLQNIVKKFCEYLPGQQLARMQIWRCFETILCFYGVRLSKQA